MNGGSRRTVPPIYAVKRCREVCRGWLTSIWATTIALKLATDSERYVVLSPVSSGIWGAASVSSMGTGNGVLLAMSLVTIHNVSDLNRILSAQRAMSTRAARELDRMVEEIQSAATNNDDEYLASELLKRERAIMVEYASTPTLSDFIKNPSLTGFAQWGTTFCVSLLYGELVLARIRGIETRFQRVHRILSMLIMKELDQPTPENGDLVDTALRFMQIELRQDTESLTDEERKKLLRAMVHPVVLATLTVLMHYQLVESPDDSGFLLTETGRNVLRHLFDAQTFIDEVASAHKMLQEQGAAKVT